MSDLFNVSESVLSRSSKDVFPFHLKHVELYHQLGEMQSTAHSWLKSLASLPNHEWTGIQSLREVLEGLRNLFATIVDNAKISRLVDKLDSIFPMFQEIRRILGQTAKTGAEIRREITAFVGTLQATPSLVRVGTIAKKRFKMYDRELYTCYDNKFVPRTNNNLEDFNHCLKRPIRKRQGRKESWFYVEHQGAAVAYYHNLLNAPHVVGGADISFTSDQTPLERIGVLGKISVSTIMNLVNREYLYKCIAKNDALYVIHRWTRKIFKQGLKKCLCTLNIAWKSRIKAILVNKKIIIGSGASLS